MYKCLNFYRKDKCLPSKFGRSTVCDISDNSSFLNIWFCNSAFFLQEVTGKNVLLLPVGASDDGAHSQNEKIDIRNYIEGVSRNY